jgi:COP9 signalosome complex subunit 4
LDRIIKKSEVSKLSQKLQPHQISRVDESLTVLEKAAIEHNIVAISRIYEAISLKNLSEFLDIDELTVS